MKEKIIRAALISVVVAGMAGCASVSKEELSQLQGDIRAAAAKADDAKKEAANADATAQDAKKTADQALSVANDAKRMASDAESQAAAAKSAAEQANSTATATVQKTENMFKKSMNK